VIALVRFTKSPRNGSNAATNVASPRYIPLANNLTAQFFIEYILSFFHPNFVSKYSYVGLANIYNQPELPLSLINKILIFF